MRSLGGTVLGSIKMLSPWFILNRKTTPDLPCQQISGLKWKELFFILTGYVYQ
jgi:hypothetical protein